MLTIHSDGDTSLGNDFTAEIQSKGMRFEPTPPYQPEQNPYAERYGAMVSAMARQMTNDANLPDYLWNEAAKAAIYIQNRIPHRTIGWKSPCEALAEHLSQSGDHMPHWLQTKPDLSNLRIYGCKAYCRINNIARLAKMAPRAAIGYLVGYESSNIWRIWIPSRRKVIRARDVEFDETELYTADDSAPHRIAVTDDSSQFTTILDYDEVTQVINDIDIPDVTHTSEQSDQGGEDHSHTEVDQTTPRHETTVDDDHAH